MLSDLSPDDWRILEYHKDKPAVPFLRIHKELSIDHPKVVDSLHGLHFEGLVSFKDHSVAGNIENIVSKITDKGYRALREKK